MRVRLPKTRKSYERYVRAPGLATALWESESRPSTQTIRNWQKNGIIPFFKVGHGVYFDVELVREHRIGTTSTTSEAGDND